MSVRSRFLTAILLSFALHAALVVLLPWKASEEPIERRIMRISLQVRQSPKVELAPISPRTAPRPARVPEPTPPRPRVQQPRQRPVVPQKPAARPVVPEEHVKTEPVQEIITPAEQSEPSVPPGTPVEEGHEGTGDALPEGPGESAPAAAPPGIVDAESLTVTKKVLPDYPQISRRRRDQGTVTLLIEIENGRVVSARVEQGSGHSLLDEAALRAVRAWQFDMAGFGDRITARVPIAFTLTK